MLRNADVVKNRLLSLKNLSADSRDAIESFYTHLKAESLSDTTIQNYLLHIFYTLRDMDKDLLEVTKGGMEKHIVDAMGRVGPASIRMRKAGMKLILKHAKGKDSPLIDMKFRVTKEERESLKEKRARNLSRADLKKLMEGALSNQDRLMFYFLYISGFRVKELCLMNVGSVSFIDNGMKAKVSGKGKTGSRTVPIYEGQLVEDMKAYINNHPNRRDPKAPLWYSVSNINYLGRINTETARARITAARKRAGFKQSVYPHLFRHSRAFELGSVFTDRQMMAFFGWDSPAMCSVYCNHHKIDTSNTLAALAGVRPERAEIRRFESMAERCPRCQRSNSAGLGVCSCGQGLNAEEAERENLLTIGRAVVELTKNDKELAEALAKALKERGF